jgi:hypothetical protein
MVSGVASETVEELRVADGNRSVCDDGYWRICCAEGRKVLLLSVQWQVGLGGDE